jgi:menaquinone-dependent protoporphyrinogen IX oxidase
MSRILVTYSTNSGSTEEVAAAVLKQLESGGHQVTLMEISQVKSVGDYDSVVIGAPMIFGWHNQARTFVHQYARELNTKKVAYFACAMRLTVNQTEQLPKVALTVDPNLALEPENPPRLSIKERFTTLGYYLHPMLSAGKNVLPVSIAFLNGKLDMRKLSWWQAAFVMVVVQGTPGDYRDWDFINQWGGSLASLL